MRGPPGGGPGIPAGGPGMRGPPDGGPGMPAGPGPGGIPLAPRAEAAGPPIPARGPTKLAGGVSDGRRMVGIGWPPALAAAAEKVAMAFLTDRLFSMGAASPRLIELCARRSISINIMMTQFI